MAFNLSNTRPLKKSCLARSWKRMGKVTLQISLCLKESIWTLFRSLQTTERIRSDKERQNWQQMSHSLISWMDCLWDIFIKKASAKTSLSILIRSSKLNKTLVNLSLSTSLQFSLQFMTIWFGTLCTGGMLMFMTTWLL